jgi:hypothetical protein
VKPLPSWATQSPVGRLVVKFTFLKKLAFLESEFEKPSNILMHTPTEESQNIK